MTKIFFKDFKQGKSEAERTSMFNKPLPKVPLFQNVANFKSV